MEQQFESEIKEFHEALTGWFSGTLPRTEQDFSGLADVIAEDFTLISPRGVVDQAAPLMAEIGSDDSLGDLLHQIERVGQ